MRCLFFHLCPIICKPTGNASWFYPNGCTTHATVYTTQAAVDTNTLRFARRRRRQKPPHALVSATHFASMTLSRCSSARKSRWRSRRFGKWCRSAGSWLLHPIRFPTRPTNTTTTVNAVTLPSDGLDATTR